MTVRGSIVSLRSTGFRLFWAASFRRRLYAGSKARTESWAHPDVPPGTFPDACSPKPTHHLCRRLYDAACVFVCWTDLVASPATRMTSRSPVPPSRFSMRQESCRPSSRTRSAWAPGRSARYALSHRAEAGERGLGVPFQPDHDIRLTAGVVAEGDLRRRRFPCRLQCGGGSGRRLLRNLRLLLGRVASFIGIPGLIGAGPDEEQHSEAASPPARSHELFRSQRNPRASILADGTVAFSGS